MNYKFTEDAQVYAKKMDRLPWSILRRYERSQVRGLLDGIELGDCVDIGAGTGFMTSLLNSHGPRSLTVLDKSSQMLEQIQLRGVFKICADCTEEFGRDRFDSMLSFGLLEFVDDHRSFISRCSEALKPGGVFILVTARECFASRLYRRYHLQLMQRNINVVPEDELERELYNNSFELLKKCYLFPFNVAYLLKNGGT